jgi:hypothetical protein
LFGAKWTGGGAQLWWLFSPAFLARLLPLTWRVTAYPLNLPQVSNGCFVLMLVLLVAPGVAGIRVRITGRGYHLPRHSLLLLAIVASSLRAQGPPFQTDDPVPVDLHHYEFYIFGGMAGTPAEIDSTGPAFEFNWGALPWLQLHVIAPFGSSNPSNNAIYGPGGIGPSAFGFTDMEVGTKIAFIKESRHVPQIGTFTMFEIPTGNDDKGLGVGKIWYKVPIWLQKNCGHWLLDGGGGETIVPQSGYRNYPYGAFLLKYAFGKQLEIGGEIFSHGREGYATPQTQSSTMIDLGGYYHFHSHPGQQFLFCYGHSVAAQTEQYAYVGMYWTWGKGDKKPDVTGWFPQPTPNGPRAINATGF